MLGNWRKAFSTQNLCTNTETVKERTTCINSSLSGLKIRTSTNSLWKKMKGPRDKLARNTASNPVRTSKSV